MTRESRKQNKAVEKIRKSIRKAVEKGVSTTVVSAAVDDAIAYSTDNASGESTIDAPATAKAAKMPSLNKQTDITMRRGATAPAGKIALNKKPLKPDSEKSSLKKLPDKRKPPR